MNAIAHPISNRVAAVLSLAFWNAECGVAAGADVVATREFPK
jgi:hypothetical protein